MQKEIKHTWFFKQSPEEVWDYLTRPELLEQWLMKTDFKPVVGHKFTFSCGKVTHCEVLEIIINKRLSYSWKVKNAGNEITVDYIVTWTLSGKDGGTELNLLHNGFTELEDYIGHTQGWTTIAKQLDGLLNTVKK